MRISRRFRGSVVAGAVVLAQFVGVSSASADLPDAATVLAEVGYSADDIATIKAGKIAQGSIKAGTPRELVGAFAFFVKVPPAELVKNLKAGLLATVDPNQISRGTISGDGSLADFAKLTLSPQASERVADYLEADDDLNLSTAEAAALKALAAASAGDRAFSATAGSTGTPAVENQVRAQLLARYQAYRTKGLAGIAPYDRGNGKTRSVADELTSANMSAVTMKKYAPAFYAVITGYPASKPAGFEELFSWNQFDAHGEPTIALVHAMFVPDGDGFLVAQRQYYVSEGFNCEQATAGFLSVQGGTLVLYANRTSTDQVEGTGGGLKRSIGSKLLSSELQGIFSRLQGSAN